MTLVNELPHTFHIFKPATSLFGTIAIMATELTVQSERAFQKQPHIFVNTKLKAPKSTRAGRSGRRYYKDVGLGFRTPKTAIEGTYIGTSMNQQEFIRVYLGSSAFNADSRNQTRNVHSPA